MHVESISEVIFFRGQYQVLRSGERSNYIYIYLYIHTNHDYICSIVVWYEPVIIQNVHLLKILFLSIYTLHTFPSKSSSSAPTISTSKSSAAASSSFQAGHLLVWCMGVNSSRHPSSCKMMCKKDAACGSHTLQYFTSCPVLYTDINHIDKLRWSWVTRAMTGMGMPSQISHPKLVIVADPSGGPWWYASFHNIVCR